MDYRATPMTEFDWTLCEWVFWISLILWGKCEWAYYRWKDWRDNPEHARKCEEILGPRYR